MLCFVVVICSVHSVVLILVCVVELVDSLLLLLVIAYLVAPLAVESVESVLSADHCYFEEIEYFALYLESVVVSVDSLLLLVDSLFLLVDSLFLLVDSLFLLVDFQLLLVATPVVTFVIAGKQLHYHVDDVLLVVVDSFVLLIVSVISVRQIEKISYYMYWIKPLCIFLVADNIQLRILCTSKNCTWKKVLESEHKKQTTTYNLIDM